MYSSRASQRLPLSRLWLISYWNCRARPDPSLMPEYALVMLATGAPVTAVVKMSVCVTMKAVW